MGVSLRKHSVVTRRGSMPHIHRFTIGPPSGSTNGLRFFRYDAGQLFDWHLDGTFRRSEQEQSWLTYLIYLNDDSAGGAAAFERLEILPVRVMLVVFRHRLLHSGRPVDRDRKYVLRSDVMYRRRTS